METHGTRDGVEYTCGKTPDPQMVTLTEALITFAFFPLLLIISYLADRGIFPFVECGGTKARRGSCTPLRKPRCSRDAGISGYLVTP